VQRPVWARGDVVTEECPRSSVMRGTGLTYLDEYGAWRLSGRGDLRDYPAKSAEAFGLLDSLAAKEDRNG
jgi:hypothetical protein